MAESVWYGLDRNLSELSLFRKLGIGRVGASHATVFFETWCLEKGFGKRERAREREREREREEKKERERERNRKIEREREAERARDSVRERYSAFKKKLGSM